MQLLPITAFIDDLLGTFAITDNAETIAEWKHRPNEARV